MTLLSNVLSIRKNMVVKKRVFPFLPLEERLTFSIVLWDPWILLQILLILLTLHLVQVHLMNLVQMTLCFINFLSNQGKKDTSENPFSIPREAWKLMIKAYGKDISKFLDAHKEAERAQKDPKTDPVPRANSNQPPILRKKQYESLPADVKALLVEQIRIDDDDVDEIPTENLDESSVDSSPEADRKAMTVLSDTDRQILQTL